MESKIRIELGQAAVGENHVYINDVEVNAVRSVCIKKVAGNLATVELELIPDKMEITGMSDVMRKYVSVIPNACP